MHGLLQRGTVFGPTPLIQRQLVLASVETGEILYSENLVENFDVFGTITGRATQGLNALECDPEVEVPLPYAEATVVGGNTVFADANGQPAERIVSTGPGHPCRSCLRNIDEGDAMLIFAARPFPEPQPYAETGPVFLHADACPEWDGAGVPPILETSPDYLVKGYTPDHRILYGTGAIIPAADLARAINERLARSDIAFVDIRSARNNCFQARAVRE